MLKSPEIGFKTEINNEINTKIDIEID
jgi:hypothetical protein